MPLLNWTWLFDLARKSRGCFSYIGEDNVCRTFHHAALGCQCELSGYVEIITLEAVCSRVDF